MLGIALIVICISVGTIFIDNKSVVTTLSNASVLLSIVLAIIAILISLWDVAGQRNALIDVKSQVDNLKKYVEEINITSIQSKEILDKLEDFDGRFQINFEPLLSEFDSIREELGKNDDRKLIDKINNMEEIILSKINQAGALKDLDNSDKNKLIMDSKYAFKILNEVFKTKNSGFEFNRKIIVNEIKKISPNLPMKYILPSKILNETLELMEGFNVIELVEEDLYRLL